MDDDDDENQPEDGDKVDKLIKKAASDTLDEGVDADDDDEKTDSKKETSQEFGKRVSRQAINAVSTVIAKWNMGKAQRGDAVKLYKMYEGAQFKDPRARQILRRTMLRARPLF